MLKIGDKLTCKKILILDGKRIFWKDQIYYISDTNITPMGFGMVWIFDKPEPPPTIFNIRSNQKNYNYLWDYFYTEKEMRMAKLKKLDDV